MQRPEVMGFDEANNTSYLVGYFDRDYGKSALFADKDVVIDASALPDGITVNALCPGPFLTPINYSIADQPETKKFILDATAGGSPRGCLRVRARARKTGYTTSTSSTSSGAAPRRGSRPSRATPWGLQRVPVSLS